MKLHTLGHCTCRSHLARPWNRPEHWTAAEVSHLETWFGRRSDEVIAAWLGRTVVGLRVKAKRLGLRKRAAGMSSREVAWLMGIDATTVSKQWIRRGLLKAKKAPFRQGPHRMWLITDEALERFIREHPEWVDVHGMPLDSPFRPLAERHRWYSLPQAHALVGRWPRNIAADIRAGRVEGRRRGTHWYVPESALPILRSLSRMSREAIEESVWRRERALERRRNRRKLAA